MPTLDEHIAQSIRQSERSGELQSAKDWGKPATTMRRRQKSGAWAAEI